MNSLKQESSGFEGNEGPQWVREESRQQALTVDCIVTEQNVDTNKTTSGHKLTLNWTHAGKVFDANLLHV